MMRILYIIILFFPIVLYGQCLEGDCENNWGVIQNEIIRYQGNFKNGEYHGLGKVYKINYNKEGENLFSKEEKILLDGEFENGRIISGKSYNENEELEFDGRYSYSDGYRYYDEGKWYRDNQLIYHGEFLNGTLNGKGIRFNNGIKYLEGKFLNGSFVEGKTYDENGELIYDGQYMEINNIRYRHGIGVIFEDGNQYNVRYNKGDIIANEYSPNDIIGIDEFTEISLISSGDYGSNELIKVIIDDNELMYTFDTGAEGFDISPSMEKILIQKGLIKKTDYYPPIISVDANNNRKKLRRVKISNIKVGDYTINNVVVIINDSDEDPLLFGRDLFQKKFKSYTIIPGKLILYK